MSLTQQGQSSFVNAVLIPEDLSEENDHQPQTNSRKRALENTDSADEDSPSNKRERKPRKAPHELLTDAEKKANHIASEKKRRQNIRIGFDQLIEIVPTLTQGSRSEAFILQKSVDHIRHLVGIKNDLKSQIKDLQNVLGESNFEESSEDELAYSLF